MFRSELFEIVNPRRIGAAAAAMPAAAQWGPASARAA